jgi:hypothetical protein
LGLDYGRCLLKRRRGEAGEGGGGPKVSVRAGAREAMRRGARSSGGQRGQPATARPWRAWAARHDPNRGAPGPLTHGPRPVVGGRERGEARGPAREKRSGPSPNEQESFRFIQLNFKQVQIVLIKRWTYQAPKIPNKIWLEIV